VRITNRPAQIASRELEIVRIKGLYRGLRN
jgi:hypothetical protein